MFFKFNFNTILIIILLGWNLLLNIKLDKIENERDIINKFGIIPLFIVFCLTLMSTCMINCCKKIFC
jgi:hypothetical protein